MREAPALARDMNSACLRFLDLFALASRFDVDLSMRDSARGLKILTSIKLESPVVPIASISGRDQCSSSLVSTVGRRDALWRSNATSRTWVSWRLFRG